ncbi:MAG TPA: bifunctional hydroxymethylpyrimidine kinase/phosphomethylpyrimidine kinase [Candidatus Dormibacteraeota bacterium]|jgi:hydroxymethylpyrimidine/phosphomethylpyrimidine kinase|nr:bifunctional hydroxymethylpyrimidine kinase/phosphomethylpyrimidine kinase [Candidatus Dormibacteraeota bacterium]
MMDINRRPVACTVAGSDSGGGAGVQADLLSFAACGVHGASVVTAVTAQDTSAVHAIEAVSLEMVARQIDAVALDLAPAAWKTGMLPTAEIVAVVAQRLEMHGAERVVVDPVLRATSGASLTAGAALVTLRDALLPLALVATPNLPEAAALSGLPVATPDEVRQAARAIAAMGPAVVVITGGHADGGGASGAVVTDLVLDTRGGGPGSFVELTHPRVPGPDRHGTGCSFSAALAAFLARGADPVDAAASASAFVAALLARGPSGVGGGHQPLVHVDPAAAAPLLSAPHPPAPVR